MMAHAKQQPLLARASDLTFGQAYPLRTFASVHKQLGALGHAIYLPSQTARSPRSYNQFPFGSQNSLDNAKTKGLGPAFRWDPTL